MERLIQVYERYMHYLIYKYHLTHDKDEYFQKLCIKLWELDQQYDETKQRKQNKKQYIMTKLHYYLIDELRKAIRMQDKIIHNETCINQMSQHDDVSHILIEQILKALKPNEQSLLIQLYQGYLLKDIAKQNGVSISCIKAQKKKLKEKIKDILK